MKTRNPTFSKLMSFKFLITDVLTQLQSAKAEQLWLDTAVGIHLVI
jgi:hypothetical protein